MEKRMILSAGGSGYRADCPVQTPASKSAFAIHNRVEKAVDKHVDKYRKLSIDRILYRIAQDLGKKVFNNFSMLLGSI